MKNIFINSTRKKQNVPPITILDDTYFQNKTIPIYVMTPYPMPNKYNHNNCDNDYILRQKDYHHNTSHYPITALTHSNAQ